MTTMRRLSPMHILLFLPLFSLMVGCTNPYARFYTDLSGGVDTKTALFIEEFGGEVEVVQGTNTDDEMKQLVSNGWLLIGYASFNAGNVDSSMARSHARQIGAQLVVLSSAYQGTVSGVMPLTLPSTTTTYHSGTMTGYGGSAMYGGTSTTYGSATSYVPSSVNRYEYLGIYWVKRKSGGWGVHCNDLTPDQRRDAGTNKGVMVANVANNGSAYDANVLPGDIIISIDAKEIRGCRDYESIAGSTVGRNADVTLIRNGERMTLAVFVRPYS